MGTIRDAANHYLRDGPASAPHRPMKSDGRNTFAVVEDTIDAEAAARIAGDAAQAAARIAADAALQDDINSVRVIAETGLKPMRAAVRVLVTSNVNIANALEDGDTLDGVTLATGQRVALAGQSTASQNGIYIVPASGAASRAADADSSDELIGARFEVEAGTRAGETWGVQNTDPITIGTTAIVIVNTASANAVAAEVQAARLGDASLSGALNRIVSAAGRFGGWPDTFFRRMEVGGSIDGRKRWYSTIWNWDLVANPAFEGRALRRTVEGSAGNLLNGPLLYLDEIGATVGDTITIRAMFVGDGTTVRFDSRPQDASIANIDVQRSAAPSTLVTSSTPAAMTISFVAPAGMAALRLYPYISAMGGGSYTDIVALWAYKGGPNDGPRWPNFSDPLARSLAYTGPRLSEINTAGLANLAARIARGQSGTIALIGDSWVNEAFRIYRPLRDLIEAEFGLSGPGYISAHNGIPVPAGGSRSRSGAWTDVQTSGGLGPDGIHASTTDPAATLSFVRVGGPIGTYRIHYVTQPGGGTFSYRLGSGSTTDVDTDAAASYQTIDVAGSGTAALNIAVVGAGSGIIICGVEVLNTTAGEFVMHKLGNSGAATSRFTAVPEARWTAALAAMQIDAAMICLGINDCSGYVNLRAYRANMETLVNRIRAARPLADIILIGPGPVSLATSNAGLANGITAYNDELRSLARERGVTFVDVQPALGTQAQAVSRGIYADAVHTNKDGGKVVARTLWSALFKQFT